MSEYDWDSPLGEVFSISRPMSDDIQRAKIIMEGKKAQREINGARLDAQKAWQAWRDLDTYRNENGTVNSKIAADFVLATKPGGNDAFGGIIPGIQYQRLTGKEHPEHERLRKIAEEADRKVLELQDMIEIYSVLAPQMAGRRSR
jgi:hypothetical protein